MYMRAQGTNGWMMTGNMADGATETTYNTPTDDIGKTVAGAIL